MKRLLYGPAVQQRKGRLWLPETASHLGGAFTNGTDQGWSED